MNPALPTPLEGYVDWLAQLKTEIAQRRQRAALAVNAELIGLYARIGHDILDRQQRLGWGAKVIDRLARDLKAAFPDMRGFSSRNLKYMAYFAEHCPDGQFGQQAAAQLPWFHVVTLLTKLDDSEARAWYAMQAAQQGWSRATLEVNIRDRLLLRQGAAVTNFDARLPAPHSALAQETLKDPYLFDFLGLGNDAHEREIETGLVRHITRFLLELGAGFAFVGRQYRLEVEGDEFFIDLLFYHTRLKCYVVVELKAPPRSNRSMPDSSIFIWQRWMPNSKHRTTSPPSACCCASTRSGWLLNTRSAASRNPSAWPNTICCATCRRLWGEICPASSRSKPSLPVSCCPKMKNKGNSDGIFIRSGR